MTDRPADIDARGPISQRDVDRLVASLSVAKIDVSVTAAVQLHRIMNGLGSASVDELVGMVTAIVAKRREHVDPARSYAEKWAEGLPRVVSRSSLAAKHGASRIPSSASTSQARAPMGAREPTRQHRTAQFVGLLLGLTFALPLRSSAPPAGPITTTAPTADTRPLLEGFTEADAVATALEHFTMPSVRVVSTPAPSPTIWPDALLLLLGLGVLFQLLVSRSRWATFAEALAVGAGPAPIPLPRTPVSAGRRLDKSTQSAIVWGIDHFVGANELRRIDVKATIAATVSGGGRPHLVRRRARQHREVWLWLDESTEDPDLPRLVDAIVDTLKRSNLPARRAGFHGDPRQLVDNDGKPCAPSELDEHRETARVAILTDGVRLAARLRHRRIGPLVEDELRMLARWPRLAVFTFGPEAVRLTDRLTEMELEVLPGEKLVDWLGGNPSAKSDRNRNDVTAWAAALALSPKPVDRETALALRQALRLDVPPPALSDIAAETGGHGRLWWPSPQRERRLTWLMGALDAERVADVRCFWIRRFVAAAGVDIAEDAVWSDGNALAEGLGALELADDDLHPPQWHVMMACAWLVALWHAIEEDEDPHPIIQAVEALYALRESASDLVAQLQRWTPLDGAEDATELAVLPWRFGRLPPETREQLRALGGCRA